MPASGRKHVELDPTDEDRVRRLLGPEALEVAGVRGPLCLDDLAGRVGRGADVADLALPDEIGQRAEGFLNIGSGVRSVDLVEVDPVGAKPLEGVLDLGDDPAARAAALIGIVSVPRRSCLVRRVGVVDELSDLHEVDRGFDAVQAGHSLAHLL